MMKTWQRIADELRELFPVFHYEHACRLIVECERQIGILLESEQRIENEKRKLKEEYEEEIRRLESKNFFDEMGR